MNARKSESKSKAAKSRTSGARTGTKTAAKRATKATSKAATKSATAKASAKSAGRAAPRASAKRNAKAPAAKAAAATAPTAKAPRERKPAPVEVPALDADDLKLFENLLLGERERLLRELGHLSENVKRSLRDSSGELSGYSFHMADLGTDSMEREKAFLFASSEGRALLDVNEALRRVYSGNYGVCESCNGPVGKARLEVVPHARLCVTCKEKEERAQLGRVR